MPRNRGTQCSRHESSTQEPNLGGEQLDTTCPSVICPASRHFVLSAFTTIYGGANVIQIMVANWGGRDSLPSPLDPTGGFPRAPAPPRKKKTPPRGTSMPPDRERP